MFRPKNYTKTNSISQKVHKPTNSNAQGNTLSTQSMNVPITLLGQSDLVLNSNGYLANQAISQSTLNKNPTIEASNMPLSSQETPLTQIPVTTSSNTLSGITADDIKTLLLKVDSPGVCPSARFGHTMVLISPVKAVLFGGAVGDTRNFQFSNETYALNIMTKIWQKIEGGISVPAPRAAHASAANDNMQLVIHGGSVGSGVMANDELWLFDMKNNEDEATWSLIPVNGKGPGKRYGHTLCFLKPFFILFGGNLGSQPANDVWTISIDKTPLVWSKLELPEDNSPCPRLYHSCGYCSKGIAQGMMILFGGRDSNDNSLNDTWGLRRHRDGKWDWVIAPYKNENQPPRGRYNHTVTFHGPLLIITGGRAKSIQEILPTEVYDTEKSESYSFPGVGLYRQSTFLQDSNLFLYGGFENSNPNLPLNTLKKIDITKYFAKSEISSKIEESLTGITTDKKGTNSNSNINININTSIGIGIGKENENNSSTYITTGYNQLSIKSNILQKNSRTNNDPSIELNSKKDQKFKLSHQAVVGRVAGDDGMSEDCSVFRKVSIDKLVQETKRIGQENVTSLVQARRIYNEELINKFLDTLLRPFDWFSQEVEEIHDKLPFSSEEIDFLINESAGLISRDCTLVRLRSPCKIFGNLFGQYNDLMRFFESFGHPSDENQMGDIHVMQYVFLGDFCDRGNHSLELVLLLLALKVKYPDHIYLVRGHHEDISVNVVNGLGEECTAKLGDNIRAETSIFLKLNALFELLPLGVLIDNQILCLHGGIGSTVTKLSDIESIKRPVQVVQEVRTTEQQIVLDILWSEYSDEINEVALNEERDITKSGFILKYGKERLTKFLQDAKLSLLITSHQWIQEGIKSFNNDKILMVYSATNYMDRFNNIAGMIIIAKKPSNRPMQIIPKLIDILKWEKKNFKQLKNISPIRNKSSK